MAVFIAGQNSRGLLRSQARMTQVCEEGGACLLLCLPPLPRLPNCHPLLPGHSQLRAWGDWGPCLLSRYFEDVSLGPSHLPLGSDTGPDIQELLH